MPISVLTFPFYWCKVIFATENCATQALHAVVPLLYAKANPQTGIFFSHGVLSEGREHLWHSGLCAGASKDLKLN